MGEAMPEARPDRALRRTVLAVALLNLGYFGIEFWAARVVGSVALFADSIDFLEDTSVNLLIALGLGWPARRRSALGMGLALLLLLPAAAALATALGKLAEPLPPAPLVLGLVGMGALAVNVGCAFLLARFRTRGDSS